MGVGVSGEPRLHDAHVGRVVLILNMNWNSTVVGCQGS
jgi:hypothetical protein